MKEFTPADIRAIFEKRGIPVPLEPAAREPILAQAMVSPGTEFVLRARAPEALLVRRLRLTPLSDDEFVDVRELILGAINHYSPTTMRGFLTEEYSVPVSEDGVVSVGLYLRRTMRGSGGPEEERWGLRGEAGVQPRRITLTVECDVADKFAHEVRRAYDLLRRAAEDPAAKAAFAAIVDDRVLALLDPVLEELPFE